jgi:branched-chain amino acid transport system permease protein
VVAALLAIPLLRLRGEYFLLGTFGLSMVAGAVFDNWIDLTNGPFGVRGIPRPALLGLTVMGTAQMLVLCVVALALCLFIKWRLVRAPFGIALRAVREDETVAQTIGKDVWRIRLTVFAISAAFTALGGTLFAYYLRFIDPTLFYFQATILIWAALFIGGCGSLVGNIVGPAILVLFPEALRFVGLGGGSAAHLQQGLYGGLLVLLAIFRPQGLAGTYRFR